MQPLHDTASACPEKLPVMSLILHTHVKVNFYLKKKKLNEIDFFFQKDTEEKLEEMKSW